MKKKFIFLYIYFLLISFTLLNIAYSADNAAINGLNISANRGGLPTRTDVPGLMGDIIRAAMGVLGTIFLILIIIGGIMWMVSGGNDDRVRKARSMIISAVIGLVIVFLSYAITSVVGTIIAGI